MNCGILIRGEARRIPLADDSVQCVLTSPPYFGLRKYAGDQELIWGGHEDCGHEWEPHIFNPQPHGDDGWKAGFQGSASSQEATRGISALNDTCSRFTGWHGAFGLEPTIEMYVEHSVEILREIRRILRPDGVCFWNIGDSYAGSWGDSGHRPERSGVPGHQREKKTKFFNRRGHPQDNIPVSVRPGSGLKPKDLCLVPQRVAIAAQAEGWWVRSDIIWAKPNPMPESVRDRPTDAYEHILMLTKSAKYFWDAEAVAKPLAATSVLRLSQDLEHQQGSFRVPGKTNGPMKAVFRGSGNKERKFRVGSPNDHLGHSIPWEGNSHRNLRNVWEFPTARYSGAHFATFPPELVIRCLQAATSEKGCCPACGNCWGRAFESTGHVNKREPAHVPGNCETKTDPTGWAPMNRATVRWEPGCGCEAGDPIPCLVLDPFAGSGTVGEVAFNMGRRFVLLDLAYQGLQLERVPPMALVGQLRIREGSRKSSCNAGAVRY